MIKPNRTYWKDGSPTSKKTQDWSIGAVVNVGFLKGLTVTDVKAVKDGLPDIYSLINEKNGARYEFTPHNGLSRIN